MLWSIPTSSVTVWNIVLLLWCPTVLDFFSGSSLSGSMLMLLD